jgi:hypothetical protein
VTHPCFVRPLGPPELHRAGCTALLLNLTFLGFVCLLSAKWLMDGKRKDWSRSNVDKCQMRSWRTRLACGKLCFPSIRPWVYCLA